MTCKMIARSENGMRSSLVAVNSHDEHGEVLFLVDNETGKPGSIGVRGSKGVFVTTTPFDFLDTMLPARLDGFGPARSITSR